MHAAGKRDSEGGEERGEKESSKAERLLGLRHGRRRVWGWPGKRREEGLDFLTFRDFSMWKWRKGSNEVMLEKVDRPAFFKLFWP